MKSRFLSAVVTGVMLLFAAGAAFAQGDSVQIYLVPKVGTGAHGDEFRAKYIADGATDYPASATGAIAGSASAMDYGLEPIMLVLANVTPGEDASISAQPDVIKVPSGLDTLPSSLNLSTIKAQLEALKIPAGWINNTHSYREIMRFVTQLFQIFQRYHFVSVNAGLSGTLFTSGITLDSTFGQLSASQRNALQQVAVDLGISTAGITNGTTLRAALRIIGPQLPPISLMGVSL